MTGPTWRCAACDTYNGAAAHACDICGTTRTEAPAAPAKTAETGKSAGTGKASGSAKGKAKGTGPGPASGKPKASGTGKGAGSGKTPGAGKASGTTGAKSGAGTGTAGTGATPSAVPSPTELDRMVAEALLGMRRGEALRPDGTGLPRVSPGLAHLLSDLYDPDGTPKPSGAVPRWDEPDLAELIARVRDTEPPRPPAGGTPAGRPRTSTRTGSSARPRPSGSGGTAGKDSAAAPEATAAQQIVGCGCLLVLVGGLVFGIVMLVMHWSAIFG